MLSSQQPDFVVKKRIVFTTFGSNGDLHPHIAIARGLMARGHESVIATCECYRQKIEALGIGFRAVRPDLPGWPAVDPALIGRFMDPRKGTERIVRELLMPVLRDSYEDLLMASEGADLLVSHPLTYAARLVVEKRCIPWASSMLGPLGFFSAFDPPVLAPAPFLSKLRFLGPSLHRPLFRFLKWTARSWADPWHRLRSEIGLPPTRANPLFEGMHSPLLVLALFSKLIADKQPDWPPQTVITGFPHFDQDGENGLPPALARFLDDGPPPIVFTLGVSAAMVAGQFYEHSVAAAKRLGRRAVLILGKGSHNQQTSLPDGMVAFEYAPFSRLFCRAAVVVHPGGIGTTGLAMRAGRPMLVVPYAHDQPDHSQRLTRLEIARTIPSARYAPTRVAAELRRLLDDRRYSQRALEVQDKIRHEDGVRTACDALEGCFQEGYLKRTLLGIAHPKG
jgi:UDP:flavonoid glycosyltransferase YjiC (YdhE family)